MKWHSATPDLSFTPSDGEEATGNVKSSSQLVLAKATPMLQRFVFLSVLLSAAPTVWGREWTDSTGKFRVDAELRGIEDGAALLTRADGSTSKVPLDRLCDCDRQFATKLCSGASLEFGNGHSLECTVLQSGPTNVTVLHGFMVLRMPRSEVAAVKDVDSKLAPTGGRSPRLADYKTVVVAAAVQPWAADFQQIPATVIDNGVLRNVPYKSFRAGHDYEINVYGDPAAPAGFEIGVRGGLLGDESAKRNCRAFICSLLRDPADREGVHGLSLEKGKNLRNGLTFEVTPPSDPDAYGGWWVSVYNEQALNSMRASDKEMESITVARNSLKPKTSASVSPDSLGDWSSEDLQNARPPSTSQTGGSVYGGGSSTKSHSGGSAYVSGYTRKDGTYVQSHSRSAPHGGRH